MVGRHLHRRAERARGILASMPADHASRILAHRQAIMAVAVQHPLGPEPDNAPGMLRAVADAVAEEEEDARERRARPPVVLPSPVERSPEALAALDKALTDLETLSAAIRSGDLETYDRLRAETSFPG